MERLRYVARSGASGAAGAAMIVGEALDAIDALAPSDAELLTVCRQLVQRNPACGPLWWLGARLLAGGMSQVATLRAELAADTAIMALAGALPHGATVLAVDFPELTARALAHRGDAGMLVANARQRPGAYASVVARAGVEMIAIEPLAIRAAAAAADVVVIEPSMYDDRRALVPMGGALAAVAAASVGTPVWLVAGVGCRLPAAFVAAAIARVIPPDAWEGDAEILELDRVGAGIGIVGAQGPVSIDVVSRAPECPFVAGLIPPD